MRLFCRTERYKILQSLSVLMLCTAWGSLYANEFGACKNASELLSFMILTVGIVLTCASIFVREYNLKTVKKDG